MESDVMAMQALLKRIAQKASMMNLRDLYMFFNLLPLTDNLENTFKYYCNILANIQLDGGFSIAGRINNIKRFYECFIFPIYGKNSETVKEQETVINMTKDIESLEKDWSSILRKYTNMEKAYVLL